MADPPGPSGEDRIRLDLAMDIAGLGVFDLDLATDRLTWSAKASEIYGAEPSELGALADWLACVRAEDRAELIAFRNRAASDPAASDHSLSFRFVRPDGIERMIGKRCRVMRDGAGEAVRIVGVIVDETAREAAEARSMAVRHELQHRVKNILAVVRSLSRRTLETARDLEDYGAHFDGRLSALARVQGIIARRAADGVDVEELVREELLHLAAEIDEQVAIKGPPVLLPAAIAEAVGLALHELAVNAVKYGALSSRNGRISVTWSLETLQDDSRCFNLGWIESGVAAVVTEPGRSGFGRQLIEDGLPYQIGADTVFRLEPGGLRCSLRLVLPTSP